MFRVKSTKDHGIYYVYKVNSHMAGANPFIQLTMWSENEKCWIVDDAANYIPEPGWDELKKQSWVNEEESVPVIDTETGEQVGTITVEELKKEAQNEMYTKDDLDDIRKRIDEAGECDDTEHCCHCAMSAYNSSFCLKHESTISRWKQACSDFESSVDAKEE